MDYRHEWKFEINMADRFALRQRLRVLMGADVNSIDGKYFIRSLYFDTPSDKALWEKLDGVGMREKFRIRFYNGDRSFIKLEKKSKVNSLCRKQSAVIPEKLAHDVVKGNIDHLKRSSDELIRELAYKMEHESLRAKTVVDYTREAFVYAPGNVRVTLDYDIRTSEGCTDFLSGDLVTVPAGDPVSLLEVKWDEYLPSFIRDAVALDGRRVTAFSKYARCRIYG